MPDFVGELGQRDALELGLAGIIEQAQLDLGGVAENSAKLTPRPSQVAPNGNGRPSRMRDRRITIDTEVSLGKSIYAYLPPVIQKQPFPRPLRSPRLAAPDVVP